MCGLSYFYRMKRRCFLLLCLVASILSAPAQDMSRVKNTIAALTSPAMHGRGYVQAGDRKAAEYIQEQFQQMGLKNFNNSYFQQFPLDINTFPKRLKLQIGKTTLTPGKDFIVNPISSGGAGQGRAVYLDTLIFTQEDAGKRFLHSDFRQNVMVYRSEDYGKLVELPIEYLNKMHEAKALIELQKEKLTASLSGKQMSHPTFEMLQKDKPPAGARVKYRVDASLINNYLSQNVIGYLPGKAEPDSFIIISAHYDHLGRIGKNTYFPGANDNASGTAMLLELAQYYSQPQNQPEHSMVFIAFGAEEAGLIGSRYYVGHPLFPLKNIRFMINLDLVGTGDEGMTVVNGAALPEEFNLLTRINEQKGYLPKVNKRNNAPNSDHYFFATKGVKAIFIYTLGGIKAYHDIYDQAGTLPLTKFKELFTLLTDFIEEL
jgi:hypothetical protein